MAADDHQQQGALKAAASQPFSAHPSTAMDISRPQLLCADTAAVEALRRLQLAPATQQAEAKPACPPLRQGFAADSGDGDCSSPLSPEAVAKLCCDDEDTHQHQQQHHQQFGSPPSVVGQQQLSRAGSSDGTRVGGRTLPALGLGCGILGASAVWGIQNRASERLTA